MAGGACHDELAGPSGAKGAAAPRPSNGLAVEVGEPIGGGGLTNGTVATVLHCGQLARLPAAAAGTFSVRPQPVQGNSIVLEAADEEPKEVVMSTHQEGKPGPGNSPP